MWVAGVLAVVLLGLFYLRVPSNEPACTDKIRAHIATKSSFKLVRTIYHKVGPTSYDDFILRFAYLTFKMDTQERLKLRTEVLFQRKPLPLDQAAHYYSLMPDRTAIYDIAIWFVEYDAQNLFGATVRSQGYCGYLIKDGIEGGDVLFWDTTGPDFNDRQVMRLN